MRAGVAALMAGLVLTAAPAFAADAPLPGDGSIDVLWTIRAAGAPGGWLNSITPTADGGFIAAGFTGRDDAVEGEDWQAFTLAFDADGKTRWFERYGAGRGTDALWDVETAANGGYVGVGFTDRIGSGGLDGWIVRVDADGKLAGESTAGGRGYDRLTDIAGLPSGGFVAVGFTSVDGAGREVLVVRLDREGRELWRKTYGGSGDQTGLYVAAVADGGFVVAGAGQGPGSAPDTGDVLVLRLDVEGREVWRRRWGDPARSETPHNLNLMADGRIRMTGYGDAVGEKGPHDLIAITLAADGALLQADVSAGRATIAPWSAASTPVGANGLPVTPTASPERPGTYSSLASSRTAISPPASSCSAAPPTRTGQWFIHSQTEACSSAGIPEQAVSIRWSCVSWRRTCPRRRPAGPIRLRLRTRGLQLYAARSRS